MVFQDAWNLDLDRLRRCYICEVDTVRGMVPFCAYNLTDVNGKALYRKRRKHDWTIGFAKSSPSRN